jgi:hypothetical protein
MIPMFPKIVRRPIPTMEGFVSLDDRPPLWLPVPDVDDPEFPYITDILGEPAPLCRKDGQDAVKVLWDAFEALQELRAYPNNLHENDCLNRIEEALRRQ